MAPKSLNWFYNKNAPPGLPSREDVLARLDCASPRGWFAYPSREAPVCFVKHGFTVHWTEVISQHRVGTWLAQSQSESAARAPTVYFGFQHDSPWSVPVTVIVMEYIRGQTVQEAWREASGDDARRETIRHKVADAFMALTRFPVDPAKRSPSAIDGSYIRHYIFEDQMAPRLYENVQQLEDHCNEVSYAWADTANYVVLSRSKALTRTQFARGFRGALHCDIAHERLVFCFSDMHPSNFMIDGTDGHVVVIDFEQTSFVPATMALYPAHGHILGFDISTLVSVPGANPSQIPALGNVSRKIDISSTSFARMMGRIDGSDKETQRRLWSQVTTKVD
ncbi:Aminoglycoside phosphotransferase [Niveomyces insectorum RCEF 264]|uniref:Aminoglycoside phosphotransferase n=1 Tax=Niveomyces insectorum RCEF 264 TaxID=1081102 RepID=A0A167ZSX6_9HYPO|nr:Aminoglycoside phosphotransferase [Niveomyces insectorum RCEF 264]